MDIVLGLYPCPQNRLTLALGRERLRQTGHGTDTARQCTLHRCIFFTVIQANLIDLFPVQHGFRRKRLLSYLIKGQSGSACIPADAEGTCLLRDARHGQTMKCPQKFRYADILQCTA